MTTVCLLKWYLQRRYSFIFAFSFLTRLLAARIVWFPSFPSVSSFYHFITQIQILHNSHINFKMTSNSQDDPTSGCYVVFFWVLSRMLEPSQEDRVHRDMWSSNMAWFHDQQRPPDYETMFLAEVDDTSLSSFATPRHDSSQVVQVTGWTEDGQKWIPFKKPLESEAIRHVWLLEMH